MDAIKKTFIQALHNNLGNISKACEECKISRACYYKWLNSDIDFKEEAESIEEYILDTAEGALLDLINSGNATAIIFFLKTKGKKRGYIERTETENKNDTTIKIDLSQLNKLNEDELRELRDRLRNNRESTDNKVS